MFFLINWVNLNNKQKLEKLDNDIDNYFHITYDGEL